MAHVSYWEINDISLIYCDHVMIKIFLLSSASALHQSHLWAVDNNFAELDHMLGVRGPHTELIDIEIQITDTRAKPGQADLCF